MKFIALKVPKNNEYSYEKTLTILSSLKAETKRGLLASVFPKTQKATISEFSLNIISINTQIYFVFGIDESYINFIYNLILSSFKNADVMEIDNLEELGIHIDDTFMIKELAISSKDFIPLNTINHFQDVDPLTTILSLITRRGASNDVFWYQIIAKPAYDTWVKDAKRLSTKLSNVEGQDNNLKIPQIAEKIKYNGFHTNIRLITNYPLSKSEVETAFNIFSNPVGNDLRVKSEKILFQSKPLMESVLQHKLTKPVNILNSLELTTLWKVPSKNTNVANIVWGKKFNLEPPDNLPVAKSDMNLDAKKQITFMGKAIYRNKMQTFGLNLNDRLLHMYIVGKTGSGKSWLMNNLAIDDIRKGCGVAILDPHGSSIDTILEYIPKNRIGDVCYFNPADPEYAYPLNLLEISNKHQKELMVSNIIQIFYKLYSHSWGPRMEHILRNVLTTLANVENATLVDIIRILTDSKYRKKILAKIEDPHILRFWEKEFNTMPEKMREESISPILNKVGQFVSSPLIRKIIQWPKSKVKIETIMNESKILLCDLSNGKIGEDNSTLLGSMIITQIQITAMNRALMKDRDMKPFFLYVDEFQNFATQSFVKILSEARKYKLGLTLANQYITQIDEDIMGAVFGNIGTLTCFNVGAKDSERLATELGNDIKPEDLTTLDKYQMITKLSINSVTSVPFTCYSLPLPKNVSGHKDKIISASRRTYGVKVKH